VSAADSSSWLEVGSSSSVEGNTPYFVWATSAIAVDWAEVGFQHKIATCAVAAEHSNLDGPYSCPKSVHSEACEVSVPSWEARQGDHIVDAGSGLDIGPVDIEHEVRRWPSVSYCRIQSLDVEQDATYRVEKRTEVDLETRWALQQRPPPDQSRRAQVC
jgi:hypothetical protein